MTFEELLDEACRLAHLPEMARTPLLDVLSKRTKQTLLKMSADEVGNILSLAIDAINHGSVKSIDTLVREHITSR